MIKINEKLKINIHQGDKNQFISTIKWINWLKNKISTAYLYIKNNTTKKDIKNNVELKEWNTEKLKKTDIFW